MNKFLNLFTTALFVSLAIFASCGGGGDDPEPPSAQEVQAALLTGVTFTASSATLDGTAVAEWVGATFTFSGSETGGTITTTGSQDQTVFPSSTAWSFSDDATTTSITRGDGVVVTIGVSATNLTMTLNISTASARAAGIDGQWIFASASN